MGTTNSPGSGQEPIRLLRVGPPAPSDEASSVTGSSMASKAHGGSGNLYLDAIVHGTGMVRLPSLSPTASHRAAHAALPSNLSQTRTPSVSSQDSGLPSQDPPASALPKLSQRLPSPASSSLHSPRHAPPPAPALHHEADSQPAKPAQRTRTLRFATELEQGDMHDGNAPASAQPSCTSVQTSATSELLTRTLQDMSSLHAREPNGPMQASPADAIRPGRSGLAASADTQQGPILRASGNLLMRMASRFGLTPSATQDARAAPERSLRSELSLRERYGAGSRSVSRMSSLSPTHPDSALQAPSPGGGDGDEGEGENEDEEEMVSRSVSGLLSIGSVLSISPSRLGAAFGSDEDDDSAPSHRSAEGSHADAASEGDTAVSAETPMSAASTLAPRDRPASSPDSSARSSFTMDKRAAAHAAAPVSPAAPIEGAQMEAASRSPAPETSTIKAVGGIGRQRVTQATQHSQPLLHARSGPVGHAASVGRADAQGRQSGHARPVGGFVVGPAPDSSLRLGRVLLPPANPRHSLSQDSQAAGRPVMAASQAALRPATSRGVSHAGEGSQQNRLWRGATLGGLMTKVRVRSRAPSLLGHSGLGSKRASKEQMGKGARGRVPGQARSAPGSQQSHGRVARTATMGAPQMQAAVAQSLQDRSDGPEGRGRTGKGKDPMTAAPTDAAGNPKGLPHMFSLKRDFWKLRGVKLKPASR